MIDQRSGVPIWASQLAANDFPPVCAMSGRPAQTWRRFHFGGFSGYLPLTRGSSRRLDLALWAPIGGIALAVAAWLGAIVLGVASAGTTNPVKPEVVYAGWVADPSVTAGPHPGYRPSLSTITGANITSAGVIKDTDGTSWDLELLFDSNGAAALSDLSRNAIAACPGDINTVATAHCPGRFLSIWVGLTQQDVGRWSEGSFATDVSRPVDSPCIAFDTERLCGKLLFDAITDQPLDGGDIVYPQVTRQDAQALADMIQPPPNPGSPLGRAIAWSIAGLGVLLALGGVLGLVLIRRAIAPRANLMFQQPIHYDTLIELDNVHPAFAAAVTARQRERASQAPAQPPIPPPPSTPPFAT